MNYEESVRALVALGRELGAPRQARLEKFGLETIATLASDLGNPHCAAPSAHVAGTNGKGSTAAMLESILRAPGSTPRRTWSGSTNAFGSTAKTSPTNPLPPAGLSCTLRLNRSWQRAISP